MRPLATRLAARHRVIRLDWRGNGIPAGRARTSATTNWPTMRWPSSRPLMSATWCRYQARGGWPALRLRRLLGNRVPRIILLSWMVLEPPPPFMAVFEMLEDPARWRQGLDNLLGGWLAGASEEVAGWTRRETGSYGFDVWSRAARAVTADYGQYGSPLRAAMELDHQPDLLHPYSQPRTAAFLAGQQAFSAANPWFSARQLDGVTHFPALEIPDATAAEIDRFLG